jgi:hypothetical protein
VDAHRVRAEYAIAAWRTLKASRPITAASAECTGKLPASVKHDTENAVGWSQPEVQLASEGNRVNAP